MINMRDEKHETRDHSLSLVGQAGLASEQGGAACPRCSAGLGALCPPACLLPLCWSAGVPGTGRVRRGISAAVRGMSHGAC